jgi:hypothetical protein
MELLVAQPGAWQTVPVCPVDVPLRSESACRMSGRIARQVIPPRGTMGRTLDFVTSVSSLSILTGLRKLTFQRIALR